MAEKEENKGMKRKESPSTPGKLFSNISVRFMEAKRTEPRIPRLCMAREGTGGRHWMWRHGGSCEHAMGPQ